MNSDAWVLIIALCLFQTSVLSHRGPGGGPGGPGGHGGPRGFGGDRCCNSGNSTAQMKFGQKMKGFMDECKQEIGETEGDKHEKFACMAQCMGKKNGILDDSNSLSSEGYKTFVNQMATEDYQKAVASEAATKCIEKIQAAETTGKDEANASGCKKVAMRAVMCAGGQFAMACPTEQQNQSPKCVKMREMIKNGDLAKPAESGEK